MAAIRRQNREHRFAVDNLSAFIDGELSARDDARIQEHMRLCASCREDAATLRATAALLRSAPRHPLPKSFLLGPDAVAEQRGFRRWSVARTWLRASSAIVSMLLVVLVSGDVILSQRWFAPQATMAVIQPTLVPARIVQEAAVVEVEKEVEKVVEKAVAAESAAQAPQSAPMITGVRPPAPTTSPPQSEAMVADEASPAPIAKMMVPPMSEAYPAPATGQVAPLVAPAVPRTSSAPGMGGGGRAPDSATDDTEPETEAQPKAMEAQIRLQPTEALVAMDIESLAAPSALGENNAEKGVQSQDSAESPILMGGSSEAAARAPDIAVAESASQPVDQPPQQAPTQAPIEVSRGSASSSFAWSLRAAALVAFGTLLILLSGLLLVRQKIRD